MADTNDKFDTTFQDMLDSMDKLGIDRAEVIRDTKILFHARDERLIQLDKATSLDEINNILLDLEKDFDFDVLWMSNTIKVATQLRKALWDVKTAQDKLNDIEFQKTMRELNNEGGITSMDFSEKAVRNAIQEPTIAGRAFALVSQFEENVARKKIRTLRYSWIKYKLRKHLQRLSRFVLRIFWGLLVFTLIIGTLVNLISSIYIAFFLTAVTWFIQEYIGQPWLQRKLQKKYRTDLREIIFTLYAHRFVALNLLRMEMKDLSRKWMKSQNSKEPQ